MSVPSPHIIVCKTWGARKPKSNPIVVGRPDKIIVHHTDGHASNGAPKEGDYIRFAMSYARMLQNDMMDSRGWNDSGHNFLVMRSGLILQGRWGTVTAIEHGRMVESAHCPGENNNPGIEHEHLPGEEFTPEQLASTVQLMAWICDRTGISPASLYGHNQFYPTECPSNLAGMILPLRAKVAGKLIAYGRAKPKTRNLLVARQAIRAELRHAGKDKKP